MTDSGLSVQHRSVIYHVPSVALALLRERLRDYLFLGDCLSVINHATKSAGLPVSQRIAERDKSRPYRFHPNRFVTIICLPDTNNFLHCCLLIQERAVLSSQSDGS